VNEIDGPLFKHVSTIIIQEIFIDFIIGLVVSYHLAGWYTNKRIVSSEVVLMRQRSPSFESVLCVACNDVYWPLNSPLTGRKAYSTCACCMTVHTASIFWRLTCEHVHSA
jgi:hypothetical protein